MSRLPQAYRVQDGCYNCQCAFVREEYDAGPLYFCLADTSDGPRPPCMSVSMDEWPGKDRHYEDINQEDAEEDADHDLWQKWSEDHEVEAWGVCPLWKKKVAPSADESGGA